MTVSLGTEKILVILPTYNEAGNVARIASRLKSLDIGASILFIDDNSPDGTGEVLDGIAKREPLVNVIHRSCKMGLGTAYIEGFKYALKGNFNYILEMDADGQHDPRYIKNLVNLCKEYDLVIGSRYKDGIRFLNIKLFRIVLASLASKYIRLITGMHIFDAASGLRCFRREVLEAIDLDKVYSKGFAFQIEMAYRAWKKGFRIFEYPIIFYSRSSGFSKMSSRICLEALFVVLRLRLLAK